MAALEMLLRQLREILPMAVVIAEFVTAQDGQYIVRALVQVNGISLASGLAAASTVEAAEDQAKERAIQGLSLPWSGMVKPEVSLTSRLKGVGAIAPIPITPSPITPSPTTSILASPFPTPTTASLSSPPSFPMDIPESVVADLYSHAANQAPTEEPEDAPDPRQVLSQMMPATALLPNSLEKTASPNPKKVRRQEPKPESAKIPDSLDLSDIIAQTDVELQRLGWSKIRGRDYLVQTYGKQTRSDLSELELYEFLSHLKAQTSPSVL